MRRERLVIIISHFCIQALRDDGLWLSDSLVNLLKQQAGE
jgi:hypothetical protein